MALDVSTAFLAAGGVIAIGFIALLIFERTRIPDVLILIVLGLLLGSVAAAYLGGPLVPPGILAAVTPYFTALALMFILFDGGINLRLSKIVKPLGIVGLHTGLTFVATVVLIAAIGTTVLGYPLTVGLLLGAILGGTSSAVVIGIVRTLRASDETKVVLLMESVLTDILCVVGALAMIEFIQGGPNASPSIIVTGLGRAFIVSVAFGVAAGLGWLILLRKLERKPYSYMLTIAVLLALYSVAQSSGGSGAMAAFVFGLILGNHDVIGKRLRFMGRFVVDERIKQFHSELSFVVRTFFFVFLGLVVTISGAGQWAVQTQIPGLAALNGTFLLFLIGVVAVFVGIVLIRIATASLVIAVRPRLRTERRILWSLMGRGLAAAVLASLPFTIPAFTSPATPGDLYYRTLMAPYENQFLNMAFFIILLTVGATTIGVALSERASAKASRAPVAERPAVQNVQSFDEELFAELTGGDDPVPERASERPPGTRSPPPPSG